MKSIVPFARMGYGSSPDEGLCTGVFQGSILTLATALQCAQMRGLLDFGLDGGALALISVSYATY